MNPVMVDRDHLTSLAAGVTIQRLRDGHPAIPLTDGQANAQAMRLRRQGLSYTTIHAVMGTYHGVWLGSDAWRWRLRKMGVAPKYHGALPPRRVAA